MRISRIARPGSWYYAPVSEQIFETPDGEIINPIDFEEMVDVNSTKSTGISNIFTFEVMVSLRCVIRKV